MNLITIHFKHTHVILAYIFSDFSESHLRKHNLMRMHKNQLAKVANESTQ